MADNRRQRVSKRTRPDLPWTGKEKGFWVFAELIQSDAFRSLTKTQSDILLFVLSRRKFPKSSKKNPINGWEPLNANSMTIPHAAIVDFFSKGNEPPPVGSTITRTIETLMTRGFLEPVSIGGNGKGDMTHYRLAHDWRAWRKGDGPVYNKAGMSRVKGFCVPGAGTFCPAKNQKRGANSHGFLHADLHEKEPRESGDVCELA